MVVFHAYVSSILVFIPAEFRIMIQSQQRMIALLEDYIAFLKNTKVEADQHHSEKYHMPSEVALPEEWAEFDHAYQLHCPSLSLDKSTRDVRSSAFWRCFVDRVL